MKKILIALFFLTYLGRILAQHNTATGFDFIISNDGAWTWYNDERAAFKNNKLYTSYVKKDGKVALSVNDIETGSNIGTEVILSDWVQKDDHNNAAILMRQDDKIMAFFSPHIREKNNYFRTSLVNEPIAQSDWGPQITQITTNDSDEKGATYNNAFQLSAEGGKIYNFMRTNNFNPNIKEYSADGSPLSNGLDFILFINGTGSVRPYVKYTSNNEDRIDFFFTDGHPRNADNSLYHCYYQTNTDGTRGNIFQTDGTLIVSLQSVFDGTPIDVSQVNKLYVFGSDGTQDRAWTHNINYNPTTGNPIVTYSKQKNINEITYHYAYWNGTSWINKFVADAGKGLYNGEDDYTGIITTNPYNTDEIFMSSNKNPISGEEDNRYEIYSAITGDGGTTWEWTEVTQNSTHDNLRPFVPKGITNSDDRVVLWFHGTYSSYINYQTRIVGEYINVTYSGPAPDLGEPIPPINTSITYGVDINGAAGPTLNPFTPMDAVANASAMDNEVTFTIFGTVTGDRDRGAGTPNDLVRDFVFGAGNGTTTGVRIEGLPAGEYEVNSFHFDNDFPAPVTVILREQNGEQIGNTILIENIEAPAQFTLNAEEGKVYEIVATGTSSNGSRFNGVSIIDVNAFIETVKLDINTNSSATKEGYTELVGTNNSSVTTANGSYQLFGFNPAPGTNANADDLLNDFAINTGAAGATPAVGIRMTGLSPRTYNIKSWHYDPAVAGRNIKIEIREAGFGNPLTELVSNVNLGSTTSSDYQITIEAGKDYDLVFRASDNDALATQARLNGIEIIPDIALSNNDFDLEEGDLKMKIYPNPFKDTFQIEIEESTDFTNVIIYDVNGRVILDQKDLSFSLPELGSGLYFLVLLNDGKVLAKRKLIKN